MLAMAVSASAEPEYGRLQGGESLTNFVVGERTAAAIDFSSGVREPDGETVWRYVKNVEE